MWVFMQGFVKTDSCSCSLRLYSCRNGTQDSRCTDSFISTDTSYPVNTTQLISELTHPVQGQSCVATKLTKQCCQAFWSWLTFSDQGKPLRFQCSCQLFFFYFICLSTNPQDFILVLLPQNCSFCSGLEHLKSAFVLLNLVSSCPGVQTERHCSERTRGACQTSISTLPSVSFHQQLHSVLTVDIGSFKSNCCVWGLCSTGYGAGIKTKTRVQDLGQGGPDSKS